MLVMAFVFSGCGKPVLYGAASTVADITSAADILSNPEDFEGKSVKVEGRIVTECPSGCWFEIEEGNARLYVDIAPSGLAIPQKVGSKVTVEGAVTVEDNKAKLIGRGVEIK